MQPQACREKFARCLAEEGELLASLEQQLLQEYELLSSNDIEGLEGASGARQQTVQKLLRVDDERRGLCRARNLDADARGLAMLLAWCDANGSLATAQARCAELAQRCRTQNERNGALVTARLNRVNGMLGMIGGENHSRTYQSGTATRVTNHQPTGRMVSTSA
jgi:flagellar biosynthesis/type III secretory pathway chaperone